MKPFLVAALAVVACNVAGADSQGRYWYIGSTSGKLGVIE